MWIQSLASVSYCHRDSDTELVGMLMTKEVTFLL